MSSAEPLSDVLARLHHKKNLSAQEMREAMERIVTGAVPDETIEKFLLALRDKGETPIELAAAARVMRAHALKPGRPFPDLLDTCGTGADEQHTLNVSTLAALTAATAGVRVAKHGNRGVSSVCGSADLLELLGMRVDLPPEAVQESLETFGFGFFFAPRFHPAARYAGPARKRIRGKTLFNCLGPLSNPAGAVYQLVGVYSAGLTETFARVLMDLGVRRAMVVHGLEGLDEISLSGETAVAYLEAGSIRTYRVSPEEFDLNRSPLDALRCRTKEECERSAREVLKGIPGPKTDMVTLNAGAALFVAGHARSVTEGIAAAREVLKKGRVLQKVEDLVRFTQGVKVSP